MQDTINNLKERFDATDLVERRSNFAFITVPKNKAIAAITYLKELGGFTTLTLITAVDWDEEGLMQLTYLLNDPNKTLEIGLRIFISRDGEEMDSAHHLWSNVEVYQRELKEMFGINFPGSPNINDNFILEGWDDTPPNRRDFDTKKYAEETFFPRPGRQTHDPAEHMKKNMYPKNPADYTNKKYNPNR